MFDLSMDVRIITAAAVAAILAAGSARAEDDDASCRAAPELSASPTLALGRIATPAERVHFIKGAAAQPGCPSSKPACVERAYLVPGDRVIVAMRRPAFVCATYINAKGGDRSGWLPAEAVADDSAAPVALADWLGTWSRAEAGIAVKPGKAGALRIEGEATYGARDPARVRRGAVNAGAIEGDVTPAGDRLSFAIGDNVTLPVDKGAESDCKVWMQRIGPWLVVDDNNSCGGMNVTFRGVYVRKR
jgi:hypothetical protein